MANRLSDSRMRVEGGDPKTSFVGFKPCGEGLVSLPAKAATFDAHSRGVNGISKTEVTYETNIDGERSLAKKLKTANWRLCYFDASLKETNKKRKIFLKHWSRISDNELIHVLDGSLSQLKEDYRLPRIYDESTQTLEENKNKLLINSNYSRLCKRKEVTLGAGNSPCIIEKKIDFNPLFLNSPPFYVEDRPDLYIGFSSEKRFYNAQGKIRSSRVVDYTDEIYKSYIVKESLDWSRQETDALIDLCHMFNLRFLIIHDRYPTCYERTVEALRERYYTVARLVTTAHYDSLIISQWRKYMIEKGEVETKDTFSKISCNFILPPLGGDTQNSASYIKVLKSISYINEERKRHHYISNVYKAQDDIARKDILMNLQGVNNKSTNKNNKELKNTGAANRKLLALAKPRQHELPWAMTQAPQTLLTALTQIQKGNTCTTAVQSQSAIALNNYNSPSGGNTISNNVSINSSGNKILNNDSRTDNLTNTSFINTSGTENNVYLKQQLAGIIPAFQTTTGTTSYPCSRIIDNVKTIIPSKLNARIDNEIASKAIISSAVKRRIVNNLQDEEMNSPNTIHIPLYKNMKNVGNNKYPSLPSISLWTLPHSTFILYTETKLNPQFKYRDFINSDGNNNNSLNLQNNKDIILDSKSSTNNSQSAPFFDPLPATSPCSVCTYTNAYSEEISNLIASINLDIAINLSLNDHINFLQKEIANLKKANSLVGNNESKNIKKITQTTSSTTSSKGSKNNTQCVDKLITNSAVKLEVGITPQQVAGKKENTHFTTQQT